MYMNPLPNAAEVINTFQSFGKRVFYVTNNSTKTREEFVKKCNILNFKATKEDILCTANLSACYLQDLSFKKKVYIIGSEGMNNNFVILLSYFCYTHKSILILSNFILYEINYIEYNNLHYSNCKGTERSWNFICWCRTRSY